MTAGNILQLLLRAKDEASAVLDKAGGNVSKFGAAIKKAAAVGGVAIIGMGAAMTTMAAGFESSMAEVRTLIPQLSEEGFGQLQQDVLAFSREMGLATDEVVPALYQAISAGVPPDNVLDFMKTAASASIGGVTELETAVGGITAVVNAYGSDVLSAQQASDLMFTSVKLGVTTFDELSNSLFNVTPTSSALGISFEEVSAALTSITLSGTQTSVATTQLRQLFIEASRGGTELDKAIREMAGKGFTELVAEGQNAFTILNDLRGSTESQGESFNDLFGSVEAMTAALQLTGPNAERVKSIFDEMSASAGATDAAFGTIADTASFKFQSAMNGFKSLMTEVGLEILPHATEALEGLQGLLKEGAAWLEANREDVRKFFDDVGQAVTTLWGHFQSGLEVVGPLVRDFWNFLLKNKPVMVAVLLAIGAAMVVAMGPVSGAFIAITGIITLIGFLRDNWEEILAFFKGRGGWLLAAAGPFGLMIKLVIDNWSAIRDTGEKVIEWFKAFPGAVSSGLTNLAAAITRPWRMAKDGITGAWGATKDFVSETGDGIVDYFTDMPTRIGNALATFARVVTTPWRIAFEGVRSVVNTLIDAINDIPDVDIPAFLGGGSFGIPDIPRIPPLPEFAEGGVVPGPIGAPVLAKVHGGETIIPPGRGDGRLIQVMPGAISFPNFVGSKEDLKRALLSALTDLERTGRIQGVMP